MRGCWLLLGSVMACGGGVEAVPDEPSAPAPSSESPPRAVMLEERFECPLPSTSPERTVCPSANACAIGGGSIDTVPGAVCFVSQTTHTTCCECC